MPTYKVTRAKNAGTKDNPHGGQLVKWYVGLESETESFDDVYWQRKPGSEVSVGDEVYGSVTKGEYGFRFKMEQRPDGRQNGSGGSSGHTDTRDEAWFYAKDQRISRAGILQAVVGVCPPPGDDDLNTYVGYVNRVTDALLASLDERTPHPNDVGTGVGNPPAAVTPAAAASPPAGPGPSAASPQAKGRLTRSMRALQFGDDLMAAVVHKVAGNPPSARSVSSLIDLAEEPGQTLEGLCERVGVPIPSDFPSPDTRDLPELNATNLEPNAVVGDAEDIPF